MRIEDAIAGVAFFVVTYGILNLFMSF